MIVKPFCKSKGSGLCRVILMVAVVALLAISVPVHASKMDDRIELSARKSYVFETYLKTDDITIKSVNGVVSLTGTVSEESHKSLARETVASLPKVKSVDNRLEVKGDHPAEYSDAWLKMKVKTTLLFHRSVNGWPCRTEAGAENAARLEDQFHDLRSFPLLI